ncbi:MULTISPECIES: tRNA lysidine(34) synthetase TilS [Lactococcus]|jgi:tRNA(Ile)-lysidine synthase|uniref:tRNA lysidine(34) synthetase TilS n=1 Tax=Lactococcus TaxID=1357 RepID=UPI0002E82539|nr:MULTISPECIES: tRNA lysidine(34) synthetase TilS [Lactococcus]MBK4109353.1 tRNA lysidine(34) synthetase TilS [Lactococcus petauri]MCR8687714.1 tRNA lysidine(34) synthetase TilS [Lactococcus petauri]MDC0808263.1 tRNA lysidine(34) synthetase TilS [Lactococcus petauri]MDC0812321.1 tRNA lysidine(34) synthetase TilS [Lactococcus petauri]MDG6136032.1 tRNA lysidine(34) synthetase TilS [Lactococcus petauri]
MNRFLKLVQQKEFFKEHRRVLVALSGGKDSMTLFNWLYTYRKELEVELFTAHVNYGLRDVADWEEEQLKQKMTELQIELEVAHYDSDEKFSEEAGRNMRYEFFRQVMADKNCTALVTAHHKGDQVETVLMREITGRRLRHLTGIPERQAFGTGELIRPLLTFSKADFDAEEYFEDVTNAGTDYLRNRVRNQYIPALTQENPQFSEAIVSMSQEITLAFSVIKDKIAELEIIKDEINLKLFLRQSRALQHFILQEYLEKFPDLQVSKAKFSELLWIIERPQQYRSELSSAYFFVKNDQYFMIVPNQPFPKKEIEIRENDPKDASFMRVDLPMEGEIEIRKRQPGDYILINGHHKKLRKFFIEQHVPLEKRENLLILVEKDIYAITDLTVSDLSKALKNDKMKRTLWVKPTIREDIDNA